ncbi:MAG: hypothetical protein V3U87_08665 [Methylococcaceae bacterium]
MKLVSKLLIVRITNTTHRINLLKMAKPDEVKNDIAFSKYILGNQRKE